MLWADLDARDPTKPMAYSPATAPVAMAGTPQLSSVLVADDRRVAVLNGHLMVEGEERAGVKLWRVQADRVVVSVAGREPVTVRLDAGRVYKEQR